MLATTLLHAAIIGSYSLGTLFFFIGVINRLDRVKKLAVAASVFGFSLHTSLLCLWFFHSPLTAMSAGSYLQLLSWSVLGTFFILRWWMEIGFLAIIVSPLALMFELISIHLHVAGAIVPKSLAWLFFGLHIVSLLIALGLLAVAFGAGLLFIHLDYKIKAKERLIGFRKDLPALAVVDRVNHWAVTVGFPLYTIGLASGFIWARTIWGRVLTWDPKEVVSLGVWFMLALVFHQRQTAGWRGRKPAVCAICIFSCLVLSLVCINFFMPTHHSFFLKP